MFKSMGMAGPGIEHASGGSTAHAQPSLHYQSPAQCDLYPILLVSDTTNHWIICINKNKLIVTVEKVDKIIFENYQLGTVNT